MAAIELEISHSRRHFAHVLGGAAIGLALVRKLRAERSGDVLAVLNQVAAGLEAGNATAALTPFDKSMAGYGQLEDYFVALTSQVSAHTDIDLLEEKDSETESTVVLRWILDLRDRVTNESVDRRIKEVHVRLTIVKGKPEVWRIVAFEPVELFNPTGS